MLLASKIDLRLSSLKVIEIFVKTWVNESWHVIEIRLLSTQTDMKYIFLVHL